LKRKQVIAETRRDLKQALGILKSPALPLEAHDYDREALWSNGITPAILSADLKRNVVACGSGCRRNAEPGISTKTALRPLQALPVSHPPLRDKYYQVQKCAPPAAALVYTASRRNVRANLMIRLAVSGLQIDPHRKTCFPQML
jgi:hypothetical protein